MKKFPLMLMGTLLALPTFARDFEYTYEGQTLKYTITDEVAKECCVKAGGFDDQFESGNKVSGDLVIPSIAKNDETEYSVTSIGKYAFWSCYGLTSVTIGNNVAAIGEGAFKFCGGLTSVTIPNSVAIIGDNVFESCSLLTSVTIPNSVTEIGAYAFLGCSGLIKAEFASIEALCKIKFGLLYSNPLSYAHNLWIDGLEIKDLVIPNSVTKIGDRAFNGCTGLTSVTIPNSVTEISPYVFSFCSGLTSVTIPNSVTEIGDGAFSYCSGLTSVSIPNSVTEISPYVFSYCSGLTSVTIPNSVTEIGDGAFQVCSGLASMTIPSSVTVLGASAFRSCRGLTSVTIPNSVTTIEPYTFYNCSGLQSVTIPNTVTTIGRNAFQGCSGLTSLTIPNSMTYIDKFAFDSCSGLTSVYYGADEPIIAYPDIFSDDTYEKATLYMSEKGAELAPSLYPWKYFKSIKVDDTLGIDDVIADFDKTAPYDVFNLHGVKVGNSADGLGKGLYIVRQGNTTRKIAVK